MEKEFIEIVFKATEESKTLLKADNYRINKYLEYNLFTFNYMLEYDQLIHFTKKIPDFKLDILKIRDLFIDEIQRKLKGLNPNKTELEELINFGNKSRYLNVTPEDYQKNLDKLLDHKGHLMTEFFDFSFTLQEEFKSVITAFKKASEGNGKYKVPYKAYISFFKYPLVFLSEEHTLYHLEQDFEMEAFEFLGTYGKITNHIQHFTAIENLKILKSNGIRIQ